MAVFVNNITGSSTIADIAAQFETWKTQMGQLTASDNFTAAFQVDISNVLNGLSILGGNLSGNVTCDAGVTVDTVDVSALKAAFDAVQSTVQNDTVTKSEFLIETGTANDGDNLLSKLQATHGTGVNHTTYSIKHFVGVRKIDGINTNAKYTIGSFECYETSDVVHIDAWDRAAPYPLHVNSSDMVVNYMTIAVKV